MPTQVARVNPIDAAALRARAAAATPFPFVVLDDFLEPEFARAVAEAFPVFEEAERIGRSFATVNEQQKVQITDAALFPAPISNLHELLASPSWLETIGELMNVPDLLADPQLVGGGMHETGPHGRLDVHVDFDYVAERQLHRRLNILVYFNPDWDSAWGGDLELWDRDVRQCVHRFAPLFNRCVIFATSDRSFHGVTALRCPAGVVRKSFAAYYYTRQAPPAWDGKPHPTRFRARPDERLKGAVLMPGERGVRALRAAVDGAKRAVRQGLPRR
jgi:2-oxoglutarate-Fe(II)-dependent oxygenase superfamily protein